MRIQSIDFLRSVAIFAIILRHTVEATFGDAVIHLDDSWFKGIIGLVLRRLGVLAVPFFFVLAGYFASAKFRSSAAPAKYLALYTGKLLLFWFFWQAFYMLPPIGQQNYLGYLYMSFCAIDPINVINGGPSYHLWFIPALIIAVVLVALLSRMFTSNIIFILTAILYCLPLTIFTYPMTSPGSHIVTFLRANTYLIDVLEQLRLNWGYCVAPLCVYAGWRLAETKPSFNPMDSLKLFAAGALISVFEMVILWKVYQVPLTQADYLAGTLPMAVGLAMYAFSKPDMGRDGFLSKQGKYVLGIYGCHLVFAYRLGPILLGSLIYPVAVIVYPVSVYCLSLLLVLALSKNKWLRPVVA